MPHLPNSALWVQVFIATAVAKVIFPVGFAAKGYINCSVVKKVVLSNHTYSLLLFAHTHTGHAVEIPQKKCCHKKSSAVC